MYLTKERNLFLTALKTLMMTKFETLTMNQLAVANIVTIPYSLVQAWHQVSVR